MNQSNNNSQEIDLFKIVTIIYKYISLFIRKHLIPIILLSIIGVALGFYVNSKIKNYESKILLSPSYGSVDYLYNQVELINSKIKRKDTIFLKNIGLNVSTSKISIDPVNSIYQFIQENDKNYDLIKLFAEDGDINKVAEDEKTSKNYKVHELKIHTNKPILVNQDINKLLIYLNNNEYFNQVRKVVNENYEKRIKSNIQTIEQINSILSKFDKNVNDTKSSNLVYFNDNNQLSDIILTKNNLIKENEYLELQKINSDNVIKKEALFLNLVSENKINIYLILFPLILITLYIISKRLFKYKK